MKSEGGLVFLSSEEMAEFDRAAIEAYGIGELVLMENAGTAVAEMARKMLGGRVSGKSISFLIGRGNNGGDGLVAARHVSNWGGRVTLALAGRPDELRDAPAKQLKILGRMGVGTTGPGTELAGANLVVDALFGYNLKGDPREPAAGMIRRANASRVRILAVDVPSGLDATTGEPGEPCVVADTTVTLGIPKAGFLGPTARRYVGKLFVADISFPSRVYEMYSQRRFFDGGSLVRVW